MNGIEYRLKEVIHPQDGRSLIVDASSGLALGALPGLENFEQGVHPALALVDGIVCSPGQLRRFSKLRRDEASLLVRVDWTNTLRGESFVLPPNRSSPGADPFCSRCAGARRSGDGGYFPPGL